MGEKKCYSLKRVHFEKKGLKVKKKTSLHFMTNFHYFALKAEFGYATKVLKPILETKNAKDVSMYVCFIFPSILKQD